MTTPQLPPLPEPTVKEWYGPNSDLNEEWLYDSDQMQAYALAALSTRPVSESIHEANARTLQALVDELREMLGVKEGESLKEAVEGLITRPVVEGVFAAMPDFLTDTDVARIYRRIYPGSVRWHQEEREFAAEVEALVRARFAELVAPIKKEQEA